MDLVVRIPWSGLAVGSGGGGGGGKAPHVWGRSCGPSCDCLWLASRPLYDLFESVTA